VGEAYRSTSPSVTTWAIYRRCTRRLCLFVFVGVEVCNGTQPLFFVVGQRHRLPDPLHLLWRICRYNRPSGRIQSRNRTLVCRRLQRPERNRLECSGRQPAVDNGVASDAIMPTSIMSSQLSVSTQSPSGPSVVNPVLGAVIANPSLQRIPVTASKAGKNHATVIRFRHRLEFPRRIGDSVSRSSAVASA
jgi:hypothetical protein